MKIEQLPAAAVEVALTTHAGAATPLIEDRKSVV